MDRSLLCRGILLGKAVWMASCFEDLTGKDGMDGFLLHRGIFLGKAVLMDSCFIGASFWERGYGWIPPS